MCCRTEGSCSGLNGSDFCADAAVHRGGGVRRYNKNIMAGKLSKKVIIIFCVAAVLIVGGALLANAYGQISPIFDHTVAIVEPDEQDQAEMQAAMSQPKPEMMAVDEVGEEETPYEPQTWVSDAGMAGVATQEENHIPTAIFTQPRISETVSNILIVLDGTFYIASVQTNQVKLISVNPATLVPVYGYGWSNLSKAYELGSVAGLVNTINQSFGLDIMQYVFANSEAIWNVSDKMGGLDISLSEAEAREMNRMLGTQYTAGVSTIWAGGLKAYTQLTVDGDAITHWQRVLNAIIDKANAESMKKELLRAISGNVSTNLSLKEFRNIAKLALQNQDSVERYQFPTEGQYMYLNGEVVLNTDLEAGRNALQSILYQ